MPVHGDTIFGHFVHGEGANLYLHQLVIQAEHGGMQRAVAIGLGVGDEVLDTPLFGLPQAVHMTQRNVAIGGRLHQNAEGDQIMNLADIQG